MTIKEFKNVFGYLNVKFKKIVPDDYIITKEDIENGIIVQKFIYNKNLTNIVNGFTIINDEICYLYPVLEKISIDADDVFPPCGGEIEISVDAIFSIHKVDSNGEDTVVEANKNSKVNAIIKIDNDEFVYNKPLLIKESPNYSEENIDVNIIAAYYYKGTKFTDIKLVKQTINTVSSWLLESENTTGIKLYLTPSEVDKTGGVVTAKVEREFSRVYYKIDSCGKKVGGKNEPGHIEDITSKCILTSSDKENFSIKKNLIKVTEQEVGAEKRSATISANFFGFKSDAVLTQQEGGVVYYDYELSFDDGKNIKFLDLETSLTKKVNLPIISKKNKYIDGKFDSYVNITDLDVVSDNEWVNGSVLKTSDSVILVVSATEPNLDKENDREALITITSKYDSSLQMKLIVSQQALEVVKETFNSNFYGNGEYTSNSIDEAELYFKVFKTLTYEDGSFTTEEYNQQMPYEYIFNSSNTSMLKVDDIIYKNGKYILKLINNSKQSIKDIVIECKLLFSKFNSETSYVVVKGNDITDYDYELCFEKHNKFENIVWNNNKEQKSLKINSLKHVLLNGKEVSVGHIPFKIGAFDEKGKEYFDETFSVKINGDELSIFPYKVSKSNSVTYVITQLETGMSIRLKLDYNANTSKVIIPLKVILYSKSISKDLWTGEGGYLLVDNKTKIQLNPCWLSPTMIDNFDTAYDGNIELTYGEHNFETFKVLCINSENKTHKEVKLKEKIEITNDTKNILLYMVV